MGSGYKFHGRKQIKIRCNQRGRRAVTTYENSENHLKENKYETKLTYTRSNRRDRSCWLCFCPRRTWRTPRWLARSGNGAGTSDQVVEPDRRTTGEGPTADRSGPAADHRHSQGRDAKN